MLKNIFKYLLAAAAPLALGACSDIDEADRFIEVPAIETQRTVLLEEFTGQECPNCPSAHETIEALLNQYPENLIAVSIHAGPQSMHVDDGGLATDEGETLAERAGIDKYPTGVINRTSGVQTQYAWASTVRAALQQPSHIDLDLTASLGDDGTSIDIEADVTAFEPTDGRLVLWVVEDGIRGFQVFLDGSFKLSYIHNHVFRAAVNGLDGEPLSLAVNQASKISASAPIADDWSPENLSVVGFVVSAKGVLQTAKCHVEI